MEERGIEDVKKIMSFDREMVEILPKLEARIKRDTFNCWGRQLSGIFKGLGLKKGMIVLDMPSGKGGDSVRLAKRYGVRIIGYDIVKEYVDYANKLAKKNKIERLCKFYVKDIREAVKKKDICDVILWIAPPHIWKTTKEMMLDLRNPTRNNGLIVVGDAYLYSENGKRYYGDYETLDKVNNGYGHYGDRIVKFIDYNGRLWKGDYEREKRDYRGLLKKLKDKRERDVVIKKLKLLDLDEKKDRKYLGLGIWVVRINKN